MILQYGTYNHADNECTLSIAKQAAYSGRGFRVGTTEQWQIEGILHADTVAALTTALGTLEDAYASDNKTVTLFDSDGVTATRHKINASDTLGGVRVVSFRYPEGAKGEYSTYRTYQITLEALRNDQDGTLLEYREALSFQGSGGPRRVWLDVLLGPPQQQITALRTVQTIIQSGRAVGYFAYPVSPNLGPGSLFPQLEMEHLREITPRGPRNHRGTFREYSVEWQYTHQTGIPLFGLPTAI